MEEDSIKLEMKKKITMHTTEIQRIIRDYYPQLNANKMDNLEEMDKFLERHNFPRLNQEELENIKKPITSNEIESAEKSSSKQKSRTRQMASQANSIKHSEKW